MFDRRTILRLLATPVAFPVAGMAAAPLGDFGARWRVVQSQLETFRPRAEKLGLTGEFGLHIPIVARIDPPAREGRVVAVEESIGRPLPPGLRRFFREATAAIRIFWSVPGHSWQDVDGSTHVVADIAPPAPFSEDVDGRPFPLVGPCEINFSVDRIAELWAGLQQQIKMFRARPGNAAELAHTHLYADFWAEMLPISLTGESGDVVAIDVSDPAERLVVLNGEGADEPGFLLGQDLLGHLDLQGQLGFVGLTLGNLLRFRNEAEGAALVQRFVADHPAMFRDSPIKPSGVVIDPNGENGRIWRTWLGL